MQFHASAEEDFLHIDSPLMYSGDNLKYMAAGVDGRPSAGGSLFFDARCTIGAGQQDKVRVIYGRDTAFGGALSGLSTLVGSVYRARAAASLSVSTLFRTESCAVFTVLLTDEDAAGEHYFNTRRMTFSSEAEFMAYVEAVRARSLFDYPVEVTAEDSLVVITTNAPQSVSKLPNARLTVYARVCHGDDGAVNTQEIVKNSDAIMPYAWYIRQGLTPHPYYTAADYGNAYYAGYADYCGARTNGAADHGGCTDHRGRADRATHRGRADRATADGGRAINITVIRMKKTDDICN